MHTRSVSLGAPTDWGRRGAVVEEVPPRARWTLRDPRVATRYLIAVVALAAAYYALGRLGLAAGQLPGNVAPVWPPTGLALGVLIRWGPAYWPGVALGALMVNGLTEVPFATVMGMAAGNTLEAVVGAWLFVRVVQGDARLERVRDVLGFTLACAAGATVVSATVGVASLGLGGVVSADDLVSTWRVWWVGDALGALVVGPVVLLAGWRRQSGRPARGWAERAALILAATGASLVAFSGDPGYGFVVFPVLMWAALRFEQRGAVAATLVVSVVAVLGTREGRGAFAEATTTERLWMLDFYLAVVALTGLVLAAVVSERDREARRNRQLSGEMRRHLADLEAVNAELEAFSYSVSHDLRAPLRNIDGFSRMLVKKHEDDLDESARHYLERIRANVAAMGTLIDELLLLSRIQRQELRTRPTDLREAVEGALAQLESAFAGRSVELEIGELPTLPVDSALVTQVYANLLSNALKFTRGRQVAHVEVGSRPGPQGRGHVLYVRDDGVGFDMAYADRLFGAFQRMHRGEDYEGSGVGLAIVARIVNRHGGLVWAESEPGVGTTVSFTLEREVA